MIRKAMSIRPRMVRNRDVARAAARYHRLSQASGAVVDRGVAAWLSITCISARFVASSIKGEQFKPALSPRRDPYGWLNGVLICRRQARAGRVRRCDFAAPGPFARLSGGNSEVSIRLRLR